MDNLIFLPTSTSAHDRWSDRAICIAWWQFMLAGAQVGALFVMVFEGQLLPFPKMLLALPTIILPVIGCSATLRGWWHNLGAQDTAETWQSPRRIPVDPIQFCICQLLQFILGSCLTCYDFVQSSVSVFLWLSLVLWFTPALVGLVYALVGVSRLCLINPIPPKSYSSQGVSERDSATNQENDPLEQAYQLRQTYSDSEPTMAADTVTGKSTPNDYGLSTQFAPHNNLESSEMIEPDRCDTITPGQGTESDVAHPQSAQTRHHARTNQHHEIRFRWQEQSGARNFSKPVWWPIMLTASLLMPWTVYYRYLIRTYGLSPAMWRLLTIELFVPLSMSSLAILSWVWPLRKPLFALVFTSFCLSCLAILTWGLLMFWMVADFIYRILQLSFSDFLVRFWMFLVGSGITWGHFEMLRKTMKIEWAPGYSSLSKEFIRLKQRRRGVTNST